MTVWHNATIWQRNELLCQLLLPIDFDVLLLDGSIKTPQTKLPGGHL